MKNIFKQSGIALVEILIITGVIAAISVAILSTVSQQRNTVKTRNQIAMVSSIEKEVANFAAAATVPIFNANINNTSLIESNIIPSNFVEGGQIINEFGGTITVTGASTATEKIYNLTVTNLNDYACSTLAIIEGNRSWGVSINGNTLKANGVAGLINEVNAADMCDTNSNTVVLTKQIPIENLTITNTGSGVDGIFQPETFVDFTRSLASGTACPGNSINNGYACTCGINRTWNGQECVDSSIRFRLEGISVGGDKNMQDYIAGTTEGTAARFDTTKQTYIPNFISSPDNPEINTQVGTTAASLGECSDGLIFDASTMRCIPRSSTLFPTTAFTNPISVTGGNSNLLTFASCANGLTWNATTQTCEIGSVTYQQGSQTITQTRTATFDGVKYKTCGVGTLSDRKCIPVENMTSSNITDPNHESKSVPTISATQGLLAACNNGQIANASGGCSCTAGKTLNSFGVCVSSCTGGRIFSTTTNSCACPGSSVWNSTLGRCNVPGIQYVLQVPQGG